MEKKTIHYNALDKEILAKNYRTKDLLHEYNSIVPSNVEAKEAFLKKYLGKCGENPVFMAPFQCDLIENLEIGDNFYANHNLVVLNNAKVYIGNNVLIGPNSCLAAPGHPINVKKRNEGYEFATPIIIEDNVWLGAGVNVMPGVTIGKNSVVGAGSVVTKDIPANVIAVGNPCKVLRKLTDEELL